MDRGAYKEFEVSGTSRRDLGTLFEYAAVKKGFRISNRKYSDDSTVITAKKGNLAAATGAFVLSDGLSSYFQSTNVYGAQAEIWERGGILRFSILIVPRSGGREQGDIIGMLDRPLLSLTTDPSCEKLLNEILIRIKSKGIALKDLSDSYERTLVKPGEKYTDESGWIVHKGPELPEEPPKVTPLQVLGLSLSIIGFVGFVIIIFIIISGMAFEMIFELGLLCCGSIFLLPSVPGALIAFVSLKKKENMVLPIISLALSAPPILLLGFLSISDYLPIEF